MWGKQDREGKKPSKIYMSVSCCCVTDSPKLESKTTNIYYLMVSMSQESRDALARWGLLRSLRVSQEDAVKVLARAAGFSRLD